MVRLGWVALVGALAIAGGAQAQVTKVTASAGSGANTNPVSNFGPGKGETSYGAYNSFVDVKPKSVTFESANAAKGPNTISSYSNVDLTITNRSAATIVPQVHSQITPAGLGFYLADLSKCSAGFGTCAQATGAGISFAGLNLGASNSVTLASFQFRITDGDYTLYDATGSVGLQLVDGQVRTWQDFNSDAYDLDGFGVEVGNGSAFGYNWNATDLFLHVPLELSTGQSTTLRYTTLVQSSSQPFCLGSSSTCIVSYAGFGDPIGRGGGIDSLAVINGGRGFGGLSLHGGIQGLQFDDFTMYTDNYNPETGLLDTTTPGNGNGVPEPAAWVSMILGFGLLGAAMRRRRAPALA